MPSFRLSWLVLAIALPACMRGCDPGCSSNSPAQSCSEQSDCPDQTACHAGHCVDESYARADEQCRIGAACAERGACEAVRKRSFLGLDPSLECAATSDQACRQSQLCRTRGLCARGPYDVGCAAIDAAACRTSARCATHEECALENGACVRRWTGCPTLVEPGKPAWAQPINLVWDYDSLRDPWHPGDVEHATLACQLTAETGGDTALRVAGHCAAGPGVDRDGPGKFLRADVALHAGDAIAYSVVNPASASSFAQLRYEGSSPALGGSGSEAIECVVVPHAVALERTRRELAAVDRGIAEASREEPDLSGRGGLSSAVEDARVHAERAALWLGWTDSELALRVVRLDAAVVAWRARLDAAIRKLAVTDGPIRGEHSTVTRGGRVCGDALHARLGANAAGRSIDATTCAIELAIDNTGSTPIPIVPGSDQLGELDDLAWLRPAQDAQPAEVTPAMIVEAHAGTTTTTTGLVEIPPGQRGIALVDGATIGALLHGRLARRTTFALPAVR